MEAKGELFKLLRQLTHLRGVAGFLQWDGQVMMPAGAAACRGAQQAAIAAALFDLETSQKLDDLLTAVEEAVAAGTLSLNEWEAASVRDGRRQFQKRRCIPKELVEQEAQLKPKASQLWVKARATDDFSLFAPALKEWVALLKAKAAALDSSRPVYDVLMDEFERGCTNERLDVLFADIKAQLVPLIRKVREASTKADAPTNAPLQGLSFPIEDQEKMCRTLAEAIGFNLKCGRIDTSVHPFTSLSHPTDVRMTVRFKGDDLLESIIPAIHEAGHAVYEQNRPMRPEDQLDLPVSQAVSFGIHESQSLLMERHVGLTEAFWSYHLPQTLRPAFPALADISVVDFVRSANVVRPGLIRVMADELTYPLHVILRWELEKELFNGTVEVDDIPRIWKERMKEMLGVDVPDDKDGCLQDMHWAIGYFGFFPTYLLGAAYAAQFYAAACRAVPTVEEEIRKGNVAPLREWLNEHVHGKGSLYPSGDELCKAATGSILDTSHYIGHLTRKYTALYNL